MAANQTVKYVDVTRSYIPMDPNSFPNGLHIADMREEDRIPVMAYDGANMLPTGYGYRSFFGTETEHPADALAAKVDHIILFQNKALANILIALTASGIWYKAGSSEGAWVQAIVLEDKTDENIHYPWTFCVLEAKLYAYRSNGDHFYEISSIVPAPGISIAEQTPTFLNMAAQLGIFRAGNRLGFWDSDDSVAWSSLDDFEAFEPNLATLAGSSKFSDVAGRITMIRTHGEGFIIYATKSIVFVQKSEDSLFLWRPRRILENTGVAYMEETVESVPNTTHFAYTSSGLYSITNAQPEILVPEVTDFFRLQTGPKYLKLIESRFLFFEVLDPNFVNAFAQYTDVEIPPITIDLTGLTFQELYELTQAESPQLSIPQLLRIIDEGSLNTPPEEGGGGGEGPPPFVDA